PPFSVLKLRHFGRLVYFEIEIIQKRLDRHVTSNLIRFLPAAEFGQINGKRSGLRRKRLRRHKLPRKIPRQKCSLNDVDRGGVHAILNDHSDDAAFGDDRAPDVPSLTLRPSDTIVPMGAIFVTRPGVAGTNHSRWRPINQASVVRSLTPAAESASRRQVTPRGSGTRRAAMSPSSRPHPAGSS